MYRQRLTFQRSPSSFDPYQGAPSGAVPLFFANFAAVLREFCGLRFLAPANKMRE
jgi:hypothetical protein